MIVPLSRSQVLVSHRDAWARADYYRSLIGHLTLKSKPDARGAMGRKLEMSKTNLRVRSRLRRDMGDCFETVERSVGNTLVAVSGYLDENVLTLLIMDQLSKLDVIVRFPRCALQSMAQESTHTPNPQEIAAGFLDASRALHFACDEMGLHQHSDYGCDVSLRAIKSPKLSQIALTALRREAAAVLIQCVARRNAAVLRVGEMRATKHRLDALEAEEFAKTQKLQRSERKEQRVKAVTKMQAFARRIKAREIYKKKLIRKKKNGKKRKRGKNQCTN